MSQNKQPTQDCFPLINSSICSDWNGYLVRTPTGCNTTHASATEAFDNHLQTMHRSLDAQFRNLMDCPAWNASSSIRFYFSALCAYSIAKSNCSQPRSFPSLCSESCSALTQSIQSALSDSFICNLHPGPNVLRNRQTLMSSAELVVFCAANQTDSSEQECSAGLLRENERCGFTSTEAAISFCSGNSTVSNILPEATQDMQSQFIKNDACCQSPLLTDTPNTTVTPTAPSPDPSAQSNSSSAAKNAWIFIVVSIIVVLVASLFALMARRWYKNHRRQYGLPLATHNNASLQARTGTLNTNAMQSLMLPLAKHAIQSPNSSPVASVTNETIEHSVDLTRTYSHRSNLLDDIINELYFQSVSRHPSERTVSSVCRASAPWSSLSTPPSNSIIDDALQILATGKGTTSTHPIGLVFENEDIPDYSSTSSIQRWSFTASRKAARKRTIQRKKSVRFQLINPIASA